MTRGVTLRIARIEDAAEIACLAGELGYPTPAEAMRDRLKVLISHPDHRLSVVEEGKRLLGWMDTERRCTLEVGERIEIVGLIVDTHYRGKSVGRLLVRDGEQWARQLGFDAICVRSNVLRETSHPFYERLGYVRRKTQHFYVKHLQC